MDTDGGGSIGADELHDPLIGLGFADSMEQVDKMVSDVDDDQSGQIEFPEFLKIIKAKQDGDAEQESRLAGFFKDLIGGKLGKQQVSFPTFVSQMKRKYLMDAVSVRSPDGDSKK